MIIRLVCMTVFLCCLGGYAVYNHIQSVDGFNGEKIGQLISKPFWSFSAVMSHVKKEQEIGESLEAQYLKEHKKNTPLQRYITKLNDLMTKAYNPKGLKWKIYIIEGLNNAFALPGGVIGVGDKLIKSLKSEDELIAIIAHERGHVDLGHSITGYQKSFRVLYSKLQEEQADDYAFEFLINLGYDPEGLSDALTRLLDTTSIFISKNRMLDRLIPSFFESHPTLKMRIERQKAKALSWKSLYSQKSQFKKRPIPLSPSF